MDETYFVQHNQPFRRISASFSYSSDRGFLSYYDPAPGFPSALTALAKVDARCFFIPGLYTDSLFSLALPIVRAKKMVLAMDGNCSKPASLRDKAVKRTISHLDLFMPNLKEALMLTGQTNLEAAGEELGKLCPMIIIKAGKDGAYALHEKHWFHESAIKISPVDTTGAGDIFNSGFLAAWLENKPLAECLRWGNVSAGLSTLGHGSSGYRVSRTEIQDYLNRLQTEN
jgi:sugar/nucleoside kinase (ribokinase family)